MQLTFSWRLHIQVSYNATHIQGTDNLLPLFAKPDRPKTPPPIRPPAPKVMVDGKALSHKEEPTMEQVQAEIKELRMALELLQARHE